MHPVGLSLTNHYLENIARIEKQEQTINVKKIEKKTSD